jgi:dolichol-phosphate mannosyltransferase
LLSLPEQARFMRGMVAWIGFRQVPIAYERAERFAGKTKYPLSKMVRLALDAVTGFSIAPLRLASHIGLWLVAASVLLLVYIGYGYATGAVIPGWTSLMLVVVVLGAVQMFVLGMIGEYLGRLFIEVKRRPLYIVREIAGRPGSTPTLGHVAQAGERIATSDSPAGKGTRPTI